MRPYPDKDAQPKKESEGKEACKAFISSYKIVLTTKVSSSFHIINTMEIECSREQVGRGADWCVIGLTVSVFSELHYLIKLNYHIVVHWCILLAILPHVDSVAPQYLLSLQFQSPKTSLEKRTWWPLTQSHRRTSRFVCSTNRIRTWSRSI